MAKKLKVSEGTIRHRVNKLIKNRVIKIHAEANPQQLGFEFICVMGMEVRAGCAAQAEKLITQSPNVYFLCGCTGDFDVIAILLFRMPSEFDQFLQKVIASAPDIIRRTRTFVVTHITRTPWANSLDLTALLEP